MPSKTPRKDLDLISWTRRQALPHFLSPPALPSSSSRERSSPGKLHTSSACLRGSWSRGLSPMPQGAGRGWNGSAGPSGGGPGPEAASPPGEHRAGTVRRAAWTRPRLLSVELTAARREPARPLFLKWVGVRFFS